MNEIPSTSSFVNHGRHQMLLTWPVRKVWYGSDQGCAVSFSENRKGNGRLGRSKRKREDNISTDLKKIVCVCCIFLWVEWYRQETTEALLGKETSGFY
jgi:hypothetical protein